MPLDQCEYIFREWHARAKARDVNGLLKLYAEDALFESPLVPAILQSSSTGVLRGRAQIREFLEEGTKRRPSELVRWHRTGRFLTDGEVLMWEYPRETPDGDQIDIMEVMEVSSCLIQRHRIYWGWRGLLQIAPSIVR